MVFAKMHILQYMHLFCGVFKDEKIDRLFFVLRRSRYASDVDYSKRFHRFSGYMQLYAAWILSVLLRMLTRLPIRQKVPAYLNLT